MEMAEMREDEDDDEADGVELHVDDSSFKGHCEPRVLSMPVMQGQRCGLLELGMMLLLVRRARSVEGGSLPGAAE